LAGAVNRRTTIPCANSAWQQLVTLAHNLLVSFQIA
jgi:hypothetical protein